MFQIILCDTPTLLNILSYLTHVFTVCYIGQGYHMLGVLSQKPQLTVFFPEYS